MSFRIVAVLPLVGLLSFTMPAAGVTIVPQFLASIPGPADDRVRGGGNFEEVFAAAAQVWESAILDDATVNIDLAWQSIPNGLGFSFGDNRTGSIRVTTLANWFFDSTPVTSEEYSTAQLSYATLGGHTLTYGVGFNGGGGAADRTDLFTVLLHEIGHVLSFGPTINTEGADGDVDVTAPLPLADIAIPTHLCCHVGRPGGYTGFDPLMFPFIDQGERRFISDADLLFVAQLGGWERIDPSRFATVPEPGTLIMVILGGLGLALCRRARSSPTTTLIRLRSAGTREHSRRRLAH